jgi:pSer/pThr/pTyr-binding forkhead associated (FHA) protein
MNIEDQLVITYRGESRSTKHVDLGESAILIGRDATSDISLEGENVSRAHCEIRYWGNEYVLKDLQSKNGTFLNGKPVSVAVIGANDIIGVGAFRLTVVHKHTIRLGETQAGEILDKMEEGKGYNTILHEIVDDLEEEDDA